MDDTNTVELNVDILSIVFGYLTELRDVYSWKQCSKVMLLIYQRSNVWTLCALTTDPKQKLHVFIDYYRYLPKQGSAEWKKQRQAIGGSEIGTLMGLNPYQRLKDLLASKAGMRSFNGSLSTRWGNLFEDVLFQILEIMFNTTLYETGSIPGLRDNTGRVLTHYSPDRIGMVNTNLINNVNYIGNIINLKTFRDRLSNNQNLITLFEGKCPFTRIPTDGVPSHYVAQPKVGACTIPIVEQIIFADAMYRKCSLTHFDFSPLYDTEFHQIKEIYQDDMIDNIYAIGFIGIYKPFNQPSQQPTNDDPTMVALSILLGHILRKFMRAIDESQYQLSELTALLVQHAVNYISASIELNIDNLLNIEVIIQRRVNAVLSAIMPDYKLEDDMIKQLIHYQLLTVLAQDGYNYDLIDYGASDKATIDVLLYNIVENRALNQPQREEQTYYSRPLLRFYNKTKPSRYHARIFLVEEIDHFKQFCRINGYEPVGILPWKLCKLSLINVPIEPGFLEGIRPQIVSAQQKIDQLKATIADGGDAEELLQTFCPTRRRKSAAALPAVATGPSATAPVWVDENETPSFSAETINGFLDC